MKKETIPIIRQPVCKKCGCRRYHERIKIGRFVLSFGKCGEDLIAPDGSKPWGCGSFFISFYLI